MADNIYIEPVLSQNFGSTWYRLQVATPLENVSNTQYTNSVLESELEFPLDVGIGGIRIGKKLEQINSHGLHISLYLWKNLNQPKNKMQDSDWSGVKNSNTTALTKFSYTQSISELNWYGFELDLNINNYYVLNKPVAYGILVSADYSSHRLFGAKGWQRPSEDTRVEIDDYQDQLVLTYKLWHFQPDLYINAELMRRNKLRWHVITSFSPFVINKDKDDHVLRNKTAKTTAIGFGLGLNNRLEYLQSKNISYFFSLELRYFRTKGSMTQEYYADDPFFADDQTGLVVSDIDNVISLFTQRASISLRYQF